MINQTHGSGVWWSVGCALTALVLTTPLPAWAADQTEHLKKTPTVLVDPGRYVNTSTGELSYDKARALVAHAFPEEDVASPDFYCAIHILVWADDGPTVDKSHWYVYRGRGTSRDSTGRWSPARFTGTRIFGSDRLALLYVHLNVPGATRSAALAEVGAQLAKPGKNETNASAAGLLPEGGQPDSTLQSANGEGIRALGNFLVETRYTKIAYQMDVVKKLPAPIQNLQDAMGMLQGAKAPEPFVTLAQRVGLYAGDVFDIRHVPSDITVSGTLSLTSGLETKNVDLGKQTYDNEGLYYWDISLGVPLRSSTQLNFDTSGGQVFAKEIDQSQLLVLANIFWRPVDTKNTRFLLYPSPIVGVALSKKPLSKAVVGLSIGMNRVQFYAGRQWSQVEKAPVPASDAVTPTPTATEYKQEWVFGINVPVRQVIDFLKSKS